MSILEGATSAGEPNAYPGTPGEFAARWNAASEEERQAWMTNSQARAEAASRCLLMNHVAVIHNLRQQLATRDVEWQWGVRSPGGRVFEARNEERARFLVGPTEVVVRRTSDSTWEVAP